MFVWLPSLSCNSMLQTLVDSPAATATSALPCTANLQWQIACGTCVRAATAASSQKHSSCNGLVCASANQADLPAQVRITFPIVACILTN
jgi:hypothetical protein